MPKAVSRPTVLAPAFVLLCGCGVGDNDVSQAPANPCDPSDFDIEFPTQDCGSHSTSDATIEISGTAYGFMRGVDCVSVMPPTITISWLNSSTGETGFGGHNAICLPNPFVASGMIPNSSWLIYPGVINLQAGENIIRITGSVNGRAETSSITIYRSL